MPVPRTAGARGAESGVARPARSGYADLVALDEVLVAIDADILSLPIGQRRGRRRHDEIADAADDGRLEPGKLVLLTGMGAGLTWGSALIEWTHPTTGAAA